MNKRLLRDLGFGDYREFIIAFGNWAYSTDFTYRSYLTKNHSKRYSMPLSRR